ncbi:hypothetical protein [Marinimicrobium sp. ABcell2]|uniref:hypothetical protein n=1 Tax=Marinimicrobium sp. ABcell2 TaxID=3069751 RepID=UPI0027B4F5CC|nr:hypothetical protein [Marinimicrobium sp. ABcell2]MDQ2076264.1 hypothetical protein [Marinimicrobium sp. ABcell2]
MKDVVKIVLCSALAAIAAYVVGGQVALLMVGNEARSLLNAKFVGSLLAAIFFTWQAADLANSKFFKNIKIHKHNISPDSLTSHR